MKRFAGLMLSLSALLALVGTGIAVAQEKSGAVPPPKILVIGREYTKPGKAGAAHEKTESAFVQAMKKAKWPTHYLAVESLSGKSRALFLTGYDSFAEWEKDAQAGEKNAAFTADIARAWAGDGEMLSDTDGGIFQFNEDYSLRPNVDIAHCRYFEIGRFVLKPGHDGDWAEIMKLVKGAYEKIAPQHWAMYTEIYGATNISERHRHRYEVNINYKARLEDKGLLFSGMSPDGELPEIVELPGHPWFIGVQFHPELKSKPFEPHPLFTSFIRAALDQARLV